jgi:hypothetical protein
MSTFMHDVSPEVRAAVLDRGETPQSMTPFETPNTWSAWRNVAARSVVGTRDRLFPVTFQRALSAERLGSAPIELEGGHLLALSKSRELAAAIDDLARAHRSAGVRRR